MNLASWTFPISFQKKILKMILKRALGQFVDCEFDDENVDLELSNGSFELRNLRLKAEVLSSFLEGFGVKVVSGSVSHLTAVVPLTQIWTSTVQLILKECVVVLQAIDSVSGACDGQEDVSGALPSSFDLASLLLQLELNNAHDLNELRHAAKSSRYTAVQLEQLKAQRQALDRENSEPLDSSIDEDDYEGIQVLAGLIERILAQTCVVVEDTRIQLQLPKAWNAQIDGLELYLPQAQLIDVSEEFGPSWTGFAKSVQFSGASLKRFRHSVGKLVYDSEPIACQVHSSGYVDALKFIFEPIERPTSADIEDCSNSELFQSAIDDFSRASSRVTTGHQLNATRGLKCCTLHEVEVRLETQDLDYFGKLASCVTLSMQRHFPAQQLAIHEAESYHSSLQVYVDSLKVNLALDNPRMNVLGLFERVYAEQIQPFDSHVSDVTVQVGSIFFGEEVQGLKYSPILATAGLSVESAVELERSYLAEGYPFSRRKLVNAETKFLVPWSRLAQVQFFVDPASAYRTFNESTPPAIALARPGATQCTRVGLNSLRAFHMPKYVEAVSRLFQLVKTSSSPESAAQRSTDAGVLLSLSHLQVISENFLAETFNLNMEFSDTVVVSSSTLLLARLERDESVPFALLRTLVGNYKELASPSTNNGATFQQLVDRLLDAEYRLDNPKRTSVPVQDEWQLVNEPTLAKGPSSDKSIGAEDMDRHSFDEVVERCVNQFRGHLTLTIDSAVFYVAHYNFPAQGVSPQKEDVPLTSLGAPVSIFCKRLECRILNEGLNWITAVGRNVSAKYVGGMLALWARQLTCEGPVSVSTDSSGNALQLVYAPDKVLTPVPKLRVSVADWNLEADEELFMDGKLFAFIVGLKGGNTVTNHPPQLSSIVDISELNIRLRQKDTAVSLRVDSAKYEYSSGPPHECVKRHWLFADRLSSSLELDDDEHLLAKLEGLDCLLRSDSTLRLKPSAILLACAQYFEFNSCKDVDAELSAFFKSIMKSCQKWLPCDDPSARALSHSHKIGKEDALVEAMMDSLPNANTSERKEDSLEILHHGVEDSSDSDGSDVFQSFTESSNPLDEGVDGKGGLRRSIFVNIGGHLTPKHVAISDSQEARLVIDRDYFSENATSGCSTRVAHEPAAKLQPFFEETALFGEQRQEDKIEWDLEYKVKVEHARWNVYQGIHFSRHRRYIEDALRTTPESLKAGLNSRYTGRKTDSPLVSASVYGVEACLRERVVRSEADLQADMHLSVGDISIQDLNPRSSWKMLLKAQHCKTSEYLPLFSCTLGRYRVNSANEYRLTTRLGHLVARLDQSTVDELMEIFSFVLSPPDSSVCDETSSAEEGIYFQLCKIGSVKCTLDYKPTKVEFANLLSGNAGELANLFQVDEAFIRLPALKLRGVKGLKALLQRCTDEWLLHVKTQQLPEIVGSMGPFKSALSVSQGLSNLIVLPLEAYERDGKWIKGLERGVQGLARTLLEQGLNLGINATASAKTVFEAADSKLSGRPNLQSDIDGIVSQHRDQPENLTDGLLQAFSEVSQGLKTAASTIVALPLPLDRPTGANTSTAGARLRLVPVAILKPLVGTTSALLKALQGARNSLNPERKTSSDEKYK